MQYLSFEQPLTKEDTVMKIRKANSRISENDREFAKRLLGEQTGKFRKPYFNTQDVVDLTGWSERTIQELRDNQEIPYIKHGRKILYPRDEVFAFLNSHLVKSKQ